MAAGPVAADVRVPRPALPELRRLPRAQLLAGALLPLLLIGAWAGWLAASRAGPAGAVIGAEAPAFALADLDGNPIRLADLRGRPVLVNFWASWCGPCVEEFPLLREAADRHAGDGLAIVGIVVEDRSEAARDFMSRFGAGWPAAIDPGGRVAARYGIHGPPETFFIDRDGIVVHRQIGQLAPSLFEAQLAAIIED